ncbi:NAD(P)/FAD-dependent oxidoreductase [Crossiella sp. CA-258035]|uniref:NAD(P)/FAD-dependent oxidoreductase n=1 Tax=Crossiella sp. CA-258035 TaxID=2981138 RepID=UPI0024BCEE1B|nr:NAD(P)/FAD-dependent oxidoreductase [Crossiella sp. CA-258035]WHT23041.1 NAD(P)/FAD-dependent oxidoreductase [Crossiella sp. CA-258035]
MDFDVVVVGGGTAGLTAAMMLARAHRRVLVLDAGEPRNAPSAHLHGFLGQDGTPPAELLATGRAEVARYGGELRAERVHTIEPAEGGFRVRLSTEDLTSRNLVVATGLRDELPEIGGLRERWGRDVLHCPYCHGHEVRDSPIAVLGGDNRPFTLHQAVLIRQWSADVVFFPHRIVLTEPERERLSARGIRVIEGEVARVRTEEDRVSAVELADGRVEPRRAVFVGPRFLPRDELLTKLGCRVGDNGWVSVDGAGRTSVPGVWAAGNVVSESAQAIQAAAAGSVTAIAINHHLLAEDIERELAVLRG